jgi:hypothetical protein
MMAMRDGGKYVPGDELAEKQDFLLVAGRTEPPAPA